MRHMSQDVRIISDLKTASVLSGSAGVLGAATVPLLLPSIMERIPSDQRALPLPLPLFCVILAVQFLVIYGLLALAGLRLARARGREPAPLLSGIWANKRPNRIGLPAGLAFGTGALCGAVLLGAMALIRRPVVSYESTAHSHQVLARLGVGRVDVETRRMGELAMDLLARRVESGGEMIPGGSVRARVVWP
jgi:hypothetical protein